MEHKLYKLAETLNSLNWSEMVKISEYIVDQVPHLKKAGAMDRDGMAQALSDMADDIIKEAEAEAAEKARPSDE